jgi:hypothetical protein
LFHFVNDNLISVLIFALLDICIGISIHKLYSENNVDKEEKNNFCYMELIYLFNPISILNCIKLRLNIFYTFINFMIVLNINKSLIAGFFFVLSILTSPGSFFINLSLLIYNYFSRGYDIKFIKKFLVNTIGSIIFIFIGMYLNNPSMMIKETKMIYYNYFFLSDSLPNIGHIWCLLPETFLKYRTFSCIMLINYQIILNISILCLMQDSKIKPNLSLSYSLLFLV